MMTRILTIFCLAFCTMLRAASLPVSFNTTTHKLAAPLDLWTVNSAEIYNGLGLAGMSLQSPSSVSITGGSIAGITDLAIADGGTGASTAAGARTNLGLIIGADVQAYSLRLGNLDALTGGADLLPYFNGASTWATTTLTTFGRSLIDDVDAATARATLGAASTAGTLAQFGATSSAQLAGVLSDETGPSGGFVRAGSPTIDAPTITGHPTIEGVTSTGATGTGALVFGTSPTLTTPILGTPTQANLANATNLPISTGVSGLGTGVATALATPSSANIFAAVTDETGSGSLVGSASPAFTGQVTVATGSAASPALILTGTSSGLWNRGSGVPGIAVNGSDVYSFGAGTCTILNSAGALSINGDTIITRGAANRLDLRNSTSAQAFRVYNTYIDSSNGEWGVLDWINSPNVFLIGTAKNGTGLPRGLAIQTDGVQRLTISSGGTTIFNQSVQISGGSAFYWGSRSVIRSPSDGVIGFYNASETDFSRIQLGGTGTSNPAIKRSGTSVAIRLADDSADAGLTAGGATFSGDVALSKTITAAGTTGAQTINKSSGSVNFAAAATSLVVTDSLVTTSSIIIATVASNDATMKSVAVVAGSGSFTLYPNAAPTAETRVNFLITN